MTTKQVLIDYIKRNWYRYVLGLSLMLCYTFLFTSIPRITGNIIDLIDDKKPLAEIYATIRILGVIVVCYFITLFSWRYILIDVARRLERDMRDALFSRLQLLTSDYYVQNNTGDLITRMIVDIGGIRKMFGLTVADILDMITTSVIAIVYMASATNVKLTLIAVAPTPFLFVALFYVRKLVRERYREVQRAITDIGAKVQENVTGIRVIKAFAQEESESKSFDKLSKYKWKKEISAIWVSGLIGPLIQFTFAVVFSIFLVIGGKMVIAKEVTIGQYYSFNSYLMLIIAPISQFSQILQTWQRAMVSMQRLDIIMTAVPSVDDKQSDSKIIEIPDGSISVSNLTYHYPSTDVDVLKNVSFSLKKGELLAIMGPTGCGKTTIVNLLMRMWNPPGGSIRIGGIEIHTIPLATLRAALAYVPQDTLLFTDTIMNNIRFYNDRINDQDAVEAATISTVHANIATFADGYNTVVGERGTTLSGGQKQRVAIARAIACKPKILLLDDCLSAVDTETEQQILHNLKSYIQDCTTIMITHRISAATLADKVLFLNQDGSVSGYGSHTELLENNENYRHVFESTGNKSTDSKDPGVV